MYNLRKCFFTFCFLCALNVYGQLNFKAGYIISNDNDTIFGEINDGGELKNSKYCIFRENKERKPSRIYPDSIKAYMISGFKYYKAKRIVFNDEFENIFLEVLLDGELKLYYFFRDKKRAFYIEKENELIGLLDERVLFLTGDSTITFVTGANGSVEKKLYPRTDADKYSAYLDDYDYYFSVYKDTLRSIFSGNENIQNQLVHVTYTPESLTNITKEYMTVTCDSGSCIAYEKDFKSTKKSSYGFYLGFGSSKIFYVDSDIESQFENFIPIGAFYNIRLSRLSENLSFQVALIARKLKFNQAFQNLPDYISSIQMESFVVGVPLSINYKIPLGKVNPSIGFGKEFSFNLASETNYYMEVMSSDQNSYYTNLTSEFKHYNKGGLFLDLGIEYILNPKTAVFAKIRYQQYLSERRCECNYYTTSYLSTGGLKNQFRSLSILVGVRLK